MSAYKEFDSRPDRLYYSSGAPFRFRADAYARAGMAEGPPFASTAAILQDLSAWTSACKRLELIEGPTRRAARRRQWLWLGVLLAALYAVAAALHPGFTFEAVSEVPAPRSSVWRHVHDMGRWHEWHGTFHIDIDGLPSEGTRRRDSNPRAVAEPPPNAHVRAANHEG